MKPLDTLLTGTPWQRSSLLTGTWSGAFALDLKLAGRLLTRYPWLTVVGGAAMAFGIAAGVTGFQLRTQFVNPSLPFDGGSRIVGVRLWDASRNRPAPATVSDLATWRDSLTLIQDVSAASVFRRNLITNDGRAEPVAVAAMTASAFRVTRVPPVLGRTLIDADEEAGAAPVIVIGHDVWTQRFASDPAVLGRLVRLGREQTTVVGVMPEGFAFPATHEVWVALRDDARSASRDEGGLLVFGKLAPNVSNVQAQAELDTVAARMTLDAQGTDAQARPQLLPFTRVFVDSENVRLGMTLGNAFLMMLLLLVCANVALLMVARTATRENEIAVRSALGASRARIVTQLFIEALALAGVAVAGGLVAARYGLQSLLATLEKDSGRPLPFWMTDTLAPSTVGYAAVLTLLSAAMIGVLPALKMTHELMPLAEAGASAWLESRYLSRVLAVLSAIALLLSLTAIYSVTAFTVSKRTREIGIRLALGAERRRVIGPILRRPLTEVALGVAAGAILVAVTFVGLFQDIPSVTEMALIGAYAMVMMGICLLACVVPARRALRADPAGVLRADR